MTDDALHHYREIFRQTAVFEDSPVMRHYGVAVDEASGEISLVEAEHGRVTGAVHLPREIAALWIETIAAYLPRYRDLFADRPYYPPVPDAPPGTAPGASHQRPAARAEAAQPAGTAPPAPRAVQRVPLHFTPPARKAGRPSP